MRIVPSLFLSVALAGCTVGPEFARPAAPTPTSGYQTPGDTMPAQVTLGHGPGQRWWTVFGSPQLDALVDEAIAHNRSLAASNATLAASRAEVRAIAGRRLPQVDANARIDQQQVNLAAFGFSGSNPLAPGGNPEFGLYTVGGGISYDLDLFGGLRRSVEQTAAQAEAQQRQTEAAHLTIAGQVVNQVLTIAALNAQIATANALLADDQRNVDLTQKRRLGGEGTLVEVLNAQSQYAADRSDLPQLDQQLAEARHLLATLLGKTPGELAPLDISLDRLTLPASIPVALPSTLVHRRPDILQAEAELHAATAAIGVATARLYPDITLGATLSQGAPAVGDLVKNAFRGYDLFAGLTAPIFHGGTLKAQRDAAMDRARASQANYEQTVLVAFGQVADLLSSIQNNARSVADQQSSVQVAERSRHLSQRSFEVGNSGILQVLESERLYQRARNGLVVAQTRQFLNVARLYVATAGGWLSVPPDSMATTTPDGSGTKD
ncbi:NodT family efflux transporter outer membrane factor (OMF) lipoprotein [Sphingomonas sp. SORGH_AS802]|uniref:efflux transporter outer membrane subunit n=1 Tax=unclassified Sphingomonas TaxID=196159 RepID=UPI00286411C7|nr:MULTISPECIES: efflux transporter outer membrane subunit [unclassified Sphingomonas]MDR6126764.1 NodT family efflux transporter outer membrane factor (OMF) lipoprotein [Sphingomonas sp. SORGH_AS_0438]MDR6134872.1 NodT family efflux transporter outer membrane factor (OMF) lipoprotein [Sphingomonas sp. SORGH_AS_0802]